MDDNSPDEDTAPPLPASVPDAVPHYLFRFPRLHTESDNHALSPSPRATTLTFGTTPSQRSLPGSVPTPRPQTSDHVPRPPFLTSEAAEHVQKRLSGPHEDEALAQTARMGIVAAACASSPAPPALPRASDLSCVPLDSLRHHVVAAAHGTSVHAGHDGDSQEDTVAAGTGSEIHRQHSLPLPGASPFSSAAQPPSHATAPALTPPFLVQFNKDSAVVLSGPEASLESPDFASSRRRSQRSVSLVAAASPSTGSEKETATVPTPLTTTAQTSTETTTADAKEPASPHTEHTLALTSLSTSDMPSSAMLMAAATDLDQLRRGSLKYALPARDRACGAGPPSLAVAHLDSDKWSSSAGPMRSGMAGHMADDDEDTVLQAVTPHAYGKDASSPTGASVQGYASPTVFLSPPSERVNEARVSAAAAEALGEDRAHTTVQLSEAIRGCETLYSPTDAVPYPVMRSTQTRGRYAPRGSLAGPTDDHLSWTQHSMEGLSGLVLDSLVTLADFPAQSTTSPGAASLGERGGAAGSPISPTAAASDSSSTGISTFAKGYLAHLAGFGGWQGVGLGTSLAVSSESHALPSSQRQPPPMDIAPTSLSPPPPLSHNTTAAAAHTSTTSSATSSSLRISARWSATPPSATPRSGRQALVLGSRSTSPQFAALPSPRAPSSRLAEPSPAPHAYATESDARQLDGPTVLTWASPPPPPSATPGTAAAALALAHFARSSPGRGSPLPTTSSLLPRTPTPTSADPPRLPLPTDTPSSDLTKASDSTTSYNKVRRPFSPQDWSLHSRSLMVSLRRESAQRKNSGHSENSSTMHTFHDPSATPSLSSGPVSETGRANTARTATRTRTSPGAALRFPRRRSTSQVPLSSASMSRFPSPLSPFSSAASPGQSLCTPTQQQQQYQRRRSSSASVPHDGASPLPSDAARRATAAPPARTPRAQPSDTNGPNVSPLRPCTPHKVAEDSVALAANGEADEDEDVLRLQQYAMSSMTLNTSAEAPSTSLFIFPKPLTSTLDTTSSSSGVQPS